MRGLSKKGGRTRVLSLRELCIQSLHIVIIFVHECIERDNLCILFVRSVMREMRARLIETVACGSVSPPEHLGAKSAL